MKKRGTRSRNPWLERNLDENGIPFPARRGVYLQPGSLTLFSREPDGEKFALLLQIICEALRRSRRVLYYSTRPARPVREELIGLYCAGLPEAKIKRFRILQADRFSAVQLGAQTPSGLFEHIDRHLTFEPVDLCIIETDIFRNIRAGKIVSALEERRRRNPEIIWLLVADGSPCWDRLGKNAAAALKLNRPDPANRESSLSLFIA